MSATEVGLALSVLRTAIGGLLLIFGLEWLRKAILRSAGLKAKHDERQIYHDELEAAHAAGASGSDLDHYAFVVSFKGVLLEGLEVAFIVVTFGANQHRVGLAAVAAALAVLLVVVVGAAARAPLARVPENTMKFVVGVMLSSFGTFWGAEGVGADWPGGEAALPAIIAALLLIALLMSRLVSHAAVTSAPRQREPRTAAEAPIRGGMAVWIGALIGAWEFVVGDDWRTAVGVALALALTALLADAGSSAWWAMSLAVFGLLARSIRRAAQGLQL
jgi:uncharacterized membrane protein